MDADADLSMTMGDQGSPRSIGGAQVYFICQQTKSRWTAAWPADVLLASNAQLARCDEPGYLAPPNLADTLASRAIFLSTA